MTPTPLVLHYAPDNASLIVRLALEQLRLPYETRLIDRAAAEQTSAAYRQLNPAGLIPVLETADGPIFETGAILLWLADTHHALAPAPEHPDRVAFLKWLFFTSNTLHAGLRTLFYPAKYVGPVPEHQAALRETMQKALQTHLSLLNELAATKPAWLGAATPSVLDFYLSCCLRWCGIYPRDADRTWFSLAAYRICGIFASRLRHCPTQLPRSAQKALAQDHLQRRNAPHPLKEAPPDVPVCIRYV